MVIISPLQGILRGAFLVRHASSRIVTANLPDFAAEFTAFGASTPHFFRERFKPVEDENVLGEVPDVRCDVADHHLFQVGNLFLYKGVEQAERRGTDRFVPISQEAGCFENLE